jgi:hypothetical protein
MNRFQPLAPQEPIRSPARTLVRALPPISVPWLEVGIAIALMVLLHWA